MKLHTNQSCYRTNSQIFPGKFSALKSAGNKWNLVARSRLCNRNFPQKSRNSSVNNRWENTNFRLTTNPGAFSDTLFSTRLIQVFQKKWTPCDKCSTRNHSPGGQQRFNAAPTHLSRGVISEAVLPDNRLDRHWQEPTVQQHTQHRNQNNRTKNNYPASAIS